MDIEEQEKEAIFKAELSRRMSAYSRSYWDGLTDEEKSALQKKRARKRWDNYYSLVGRNTKKSRKRKGIDTDTN